MACFELAWTLPCAALFLVEAMAPVADALGVALVRLDRQLVSRVR